METPGWIPLGVGLSVSVGVVFFVLLPVRSFLRARRRYRVEVRYAHKPEFDEATLTAALAVLPGAKLETAATRPNRWLAGHPTEGTYSMQLQEDELEAEDGVPAGRCSASGIPLVMVAAALLAGSASAQDGGLSRLERRLVDAIGGLERDKDFSLQGGTPDAGLKLGPNPFARPDISRQSEPQFDALEDEFLRRCWELARRPPMEVASQPDAVQIIRWLVDHERVDAPIPPARDQFRSLASTVDAVLANDARKAFRLAADLDRTRVDLKLLGAEGAVPALEQFMATVRRADRVEAENPFAPRAPIDTGPLREKLKPYASVVERGLREWTLSEVKAKRLFWTVPAVAPGTLVLASHRRLSSIVTLGEHTFFLEWNDAIGALCTVWRLSKGGELEAVASRIPIHAWSFRVHRGGFAWTTFDGALVTMELGGAPRTVLEFENYEVASTLERSRDTLVFLQKRRNAKGVPDWVLASWRGEGQPVVGLAFGHGRAWLAGLSQENIVLRHGGAVVLLESTGGVLAQVDVTALKLWGVQTRLDDGTFVFLGDSPTGGSRLYELKPGKTTLVPSLQTPSGVRLAENADVVALVRGVLVQSDLSVVQAEAIVGVGVWQSMLSSVRLSGNELLVSAFDASRGWGTLHRIPLSPSNPSRPRGP